MKNIITFILAIFAVVIAFKVLKVVLTGILLVISAIIGFFLCWLLLELAWEGIKKIVVFVAELFARQNY